MRCLLIGLSAFALGGMTAAGLSISELAPQAHAWAVEPQVRTDPAQVRIPVSAASLSQAYAAGLIDKPIRSVLSLPSRMKYGDFRWNEEAVPRGPTWIRVDLRSQIISVFRAGHEIGTAVIIYGANGVPTPTGRFPVLAKLRNHRSTTYDAPMPYTLRLTSDGISIHASNVRWGYATHGCIGVPESFAAKLFDAVHVGDEVLVVDRPQRPRTATS